MSAERLNGSWQQRIAEYLEEAYNSRAGFGETEVASNIAFIQSNANYNFLPSNFRGFSGSGGSYEVADRMFQVHTGTSVFGYGAIQSFRSLNYKSGQGGLARFTAIFDNAVENSWQGIGLLTIADEISFGYNGTTFGIWHRYNGIAEVRTIKITGASAASTNLTLTLNGVAYTIPLTNGTVQHNAYQIATWLNANQSIWYADQLNDEVIIMAASDGEKDGTYTFSHATATGTITRNTQGQTKTSDFYPKDEWNGNVFDGHNPSKGNVYQIKYQYLGFGAIKFYIEEPDSGSFILAHTIRYANKNLLPSMTNPSLRFGMYAYSLGSTTNLTVKSASVAAFVQGYETKTRNPRSVINTATISAGNLYNILTLRNRRTYNYIVNQVEIEPITLTIASESNKNLSIQLRANPTITGETNFQLAGSNLVGDVDYSATTISGGTLLAAFTVPPGGSVDIDLSNKRIRIPPSLTLSVCATKVSGTAAEATASLTYYEDI